MCVVIGANVKGEALSIKVGRSVGCRGQRKTDQEASRFSRGAPPVSEKSPEGKAVPRMQTKWHFRDGVTPPSNLHKHDSHSICRSIKSRSQIWMVKGLGVLEQLDVSNHDQRVASLGCCLKNKLCYIAHTKWKRVKGGYAIKNSRVEGVVPGLLNVVHTYRS